MVPPPPSFPVPRGTATAIGLPNPAASAIPTTSSTALPSSGVLAATPGPLTRETLVPSQPVRPSSGSRIALGQQPSRSPARDRAFSLVGGSWACSTKSGEPAKHTYTRAADGTIKLHNELVIAKKVFAIDEVYQFNKSNGRWYTVTQGNAYAGVAPPWEDAEWIFEGSVPHGNSRLPVRMIYVARGDRAFERDFQRYENGDWKNFTSETCHRR